MCTLFVQNIAALFSLSLKLRYLPLFLYKDGFLCFSGTWDRESTGGRIWAGDYLMGESGLFQLQYRVHWCDSPTIVVFDPLRKLQR